MIHLEEHKISMWKSKCSEFNRYRDSVSNEEYKANYVIIKSKHIDS